MPVVAKFSPAGPSLERTAQPAHAPARRKGLWHWLPLARWVPIRTLRERHRDRVRRHLLELDARDRYLRFGYAAGDAAIERYVAALDFSKDQVFGIFNRHLKLIAISHVAYAEDAGEPLAEFAVSVARHARGRGFGRRLFAHAVMHARNRGVHRMLIHALSENVAMLRIAQQAGATVQREGGESEAWLQLPPDSLGSHVEAMVSMQAAEWDYGVKFESRRLARLEGKLRFLSRR